MTEQTTKRSLSPSFAELFTPQLITVLRDGYGPMQLRADTLAGRSVAIVALPLSMAIAIASGATPAQGLYTAIVGGFLVSLLGGSRFQIDGPAGAFIVLVSGTFVLHRVDGLILATFLSGLTLNDETAALLGKLPVRWAARGSITPAAVLLSVVTAGIIFGLRPWRPRWPRILIAVTVAAVGVAPLELPVQTIGTRFGGIPSSLPAPMLPDMSTERMLEVFPAAISFTLLGAIKSLLSAVVADGMTGRQHRSNG